MMKHYPMNNLSGYKSSRSSTLIHPPNQNIRDNDYQVVMVEKV